jgi:DNA repair protein RadD
MGRRETHLPIIFGGVASAKSDPSMFGWRDILMIDEAHLLSNDASSMYQRVITGLKEINPKLKVIGLSATPYRMGQGLITDGGLFTDICFDITGFEAFNWLIANGHIAPLIPRPTHTQLDVSNVGIVNGDYVKGELQKAVDKAEVTYAALQEVLHYGQDRASWLIFASGVEHSEHIAEMLQSLGVDAASVHSKIEGTERDNRIAAFKNGSLRAIVNNNVLTTGFDHPPIDLIAMLRPTQSPGLWVQMLGRGTRPSEGKSNCLVLDFARNTPRLGPINDPMIPKKKGDKTGEPPVKICEACGVYNHASVRFCCNCGAEFQFKNKLVSVAGSDALIKLSEPTYEMLDVGRMVCNKHQKVGAEKPVLKVSYYCKDYKAGFAPINEWICLEHKGLPLGKAREWWRKSHPGEPPLTVDDALHKQSEIKPPKRIKIRTDVKYPEVVGHEY